ncbi:sphingosine 1-phosphate receptor 2 isoform X2 [Denticeps clupeoides]|uniref:G-protein coupled receptors family 1 profile domain-containing protein n=1 Tax=Denticeps clupeoides TaxID=299321 RepID=A0AAY4E7Z1_9TELE|nr:sphingosine 1-phosphate receptor 2-like isoform X2 [Denticeps clupeoides]
MEACGSTSSTSSSASMLQDTQITVLSLLYMVFLSLSLMGSLSTVLISIAKRKRLHEQVMPLVQLGAADFLASATLMSATSLNFLPYGALPDSVVLCERGLPLSLMFYCVSFLLAILYATESIRATQGWRESVGDGDQEELMRRKRNFVLLCVAVWVLPVVLFFLYTETLTTSMVPIGPACPVPTSSCNSCLPFLHLHGDNCSDVDDSHNDFVRGFLLVTLISVLLTSTVVYCKLQRWSQRYEHTGMLTVEGDGFSRRQLRDVLSSSRCITLVIIVCWTPALVLVVLSFITQIQQEDIFVLYILQAVSMSLQGFLNSVVYAWRRKNFRLAVLGERMPLLSSHQRATPFFEESLPTPP